MKRSRIKTNINNRIFDLINAIHSDDKKRALQRYKMYKLRYELSENQA